MTTQSLMDEVHEATRDPAMAILKLRLQGSYADVVCDPTTPRAKAEELHAIAQGAGWPELWAKHGLTFPTPGGPAPPQRSKSPQTPPEAPEPVSAPDIAPTAPSAAPEPPPNAAPTPEYRRPPGTSTCPLGEPVMITLTCEKCGIEFQKPKTKGRRPRYCGRPAPECGAIPPSKAKKRRTS